MASSPEEWARVRELFQSALALPAELRSAHIAELCGDDRTLREQVELLLASHQRANGFLGTRDALTTIDGIRTTLEGCRLGPYQLGARLGAGGMGEVYKARDTRLDRTVAIKVLPAHLATAPQARERFEREARAVAALNHPHICTLYDVGSHDGVDFLVMEYLEGVTLTCPVPADDAVKLGIDIAGALAAAHRLGIVHRDLKPGNVMVTPNGVKLLDFGLAKSTQSDISVTQSGIVVGTVAYMSPEQVNGQPLDARSDIFSFGALLYEMVSGKAAFDGSTVGQVMSAILRDDPPALEESALEPIVRKCLAKDSNDRYRTTDEVKAALEQIAVSPSKAARWNSTRAPVRPGRARVSRIAMILAVSLVLAAVALTWWTVARRAEDPPPDLSFRQITSLGNVIEAALSPDGRSLAFVTDTQGDRRLMMRDLAGGPTIELAHGPGLTFPVWTRDGAEIHFSTNAGGFLVSRLGGAPRKSFPWRPFTWSPDGSKIATASVSAPAFSIATTDGRGPGDFMPVEHARFLHGIDWHLRSNRLLLFGLDEQDQSSIWIATPDGKNVRRVFLGPEHIESAFWNPTADVIYAFRVRNLSSDLVALSVSDGGPATARVLASGLPLSAMSGISADSSALLQVRGVISTNLWALDLNGPQPVHRRVTSGTGFFSDPDISPDGRWIAAVFKLGSKTAVVKIPITGGEPVPLISGENTFASPSWSPDGTRIAFGSNREGGPGIWLMEADGGQLQKLETSALSMHLAVRWTPEGRLAWQQYTDASNHMNFRVRDLKTGVERLLATPTTNGWLFYPSFSPSGDRAAFRWNNRPDTSGIWTAAWPDGTPRLLANGSRRPIGWSHDGNAIYTHEGREMQPVISMIDVASGKSTNVTRLPVGVIAGGTASRDGRTLVVTVQEQTGDAWLLEHLNTRSTR
jgi:Tol biopolymer transport system component/predicted Ser/Thr protein kinase